MQITRTSLDTGTGRSDWFTGSVYIDAIATPSGSSRLSASSVHFTQGYPSNLGMAQEVRCGTVRTAAAGARPRAAVAPAAASRDGAIDRDDSHVPDAVVGPDRAGRLDPARGDRARREP